MLREWLQAFEKGTREGVPPLQPVITADGQLVNDQFLLFNKLLVAPVVERDASKRLVYLPPGTWYRFGNNILQFSGNSWIVEDVTLSDIPCFVKAGSTIETCAPGMTTKETMQNAFRTDCYK